MFIESVKAMPQFYSFPIFVEIQMNPILTKILWIIKRKNPLYTLYSPSFYSLITSLCLKITSSLTVCPAKFKIQS